MSSGHSGAEAGRARAEGLAAYDAGDWVRARLRLSAALSAQPGDATALYYMGLALRNLGDLALAATWLDRAIAAAPGAPEPLADRGLLAWREGDDERAVPLLEAALLELPANLRLAGYLAEAHVDAGREAQATAVLETALAAGGAWPEAAAELVAHPGVRLALRAALTARFGPEAAHWPLPEPKRLSLCMIVRNEAAVLPRCLASARGMADELIVVDTGSTDETAAVAESFGAMVYHHAWADDFAEARNESLRHATGDWILILDADCEIDRASRRGLRRFLQRPTTSGPAFVAYQALLADHLTGDPSRIDAHSHWLAIFPNDPQLRFVGAIHEQLVDAHQPPRAIAMRPLNDLVVHHYGYAEAAMARQGKRTRNMRILLRELAARPDDAFVRYNLALQWRLEGNLDEAVGHAGACLALLAATREGFRAGYAEAAHTLHADLLVRRRAYDEAAAACEAALARYPRSADLLGMLGLCRLMTGRAQGAIAPLEAALAEGGAIGTGASQAPYQGWLADALLALGHWRLGDQARSDAHLRRMWETADDRQEALERLIALAAALTGSPELGVSLMARLGVEVRLA